MTEPRTLSRLEAADFINRSQRPLPRLYGDALLEAARGDSRIVCLVADLAAPTETDIFRDAFPDRFHNVGIAEANMIGLASGMARCGEIPFVHTFSTFATRRCLDQVTLQAGYPNLPIKIAGFLPGLSTILGVSHQAIEDLSIMRAVPNMMVLEPAGLAYFAAAVRLALEHEGPVYLRMKRPETPPEEPVAARPLEMGRGILLREGADATIIACGLSVAEAVAAAELLAVEGIEASVVDMAFIKPLDAGLVLERAEATGAMVTAENHMVCGGLGSAVAEVLCDAGVGLPFKRVGLGDRFAEGGTTPYLFKKYGLDRTAIADAVRGVVAQKARSG